MIDFSNCVRDYFFTRDFLALVLGISAIVLPSFAGEFERDVSVTLFSVFVSTKRNLEARPRVTIPSISLGSNSRHSSITSNLRFFDKEFSTAVSVEVTDSERNWTGSESTNVSIEDCEIDRFREWEDVAEDMSQAPGAIKVVGDNKMAGRMASSSAEEGVGEESEAGGDLVDGVGFRRFLVLTLIAGPSSTIEALIEATSDAAPDVEDGEGLDSTLVRSAERGSCVSRAFLPARRVRFNGGSPSSGRLK